MYSIPIQYVNHQLLLELPMISKKKMVVREVNMMKIMMMLLVIKKW